MFIYVYKGFKMGVRLGRLKTVKSQVLMEKSE